MEDETQVKGVNGYVSVDLHPEDAHLLDSYLREIGLEDYINPNELHATLFYARDGMKPLDDIDPEITYVANISDNIEIMGKDPWRAIVVHLDAPDLAQRHEQIKEETGAKHSYPDFRAHLSLKYSPTDEDLELVLANPLPFTSVRFINEHQEDIEE